MRKTLSQLVRRIHRLERERARILEELLIDEPLLKGSLSRVKRTCGKPSCHCAQEPAHEAWVLMSTPSPGRQRRCQVVRQDDVEEVQERVETYKHFRERLRELEAIQKEQKALLRGFMENRNVPYE